MYVPEEFIYYNIKELQDFIEKYNFATLISSSNDNLHASHVPMILNRNSGYGTLAWHVAKLNPHSTLLQNNCNVLCIFHGPHSYISPNWYRSQPNVPTWNYAVVHVQGKPRIATQEELSHDLETMVNFHEKQITDMNSYVVPKEYKAKLINHIVGYRMDILKIECQFKLGQNRGQDDRKHLLSHLTDDFFELSLKHLSSDIK